MGGGCFAKYGRVSLYCRLLKRTSQQFDDDYGRDDDLTGDLTGDTKIWLWGSTCMGMKVMAGKNEERDGDVFAFGGWGVVDEGWWMRIGG